MFLRRFLQLLPNLVGMDRVKALFAHAYPHRKGREGAAHLLNGMPGLFPNHWARYAQELRRRKSVYLSPPQDERIRIEEKEPALAGRREEGREKGVFNEDSSMSLPERFAIREKACGKW